jgi:hypothetical protein
MRELNILCSEENGLGSPKRARKTACGALFSSIKSVQLIEKKIPNKPPSEELGDKKDSLLSKITAFPTSLMAFSS